MKRLLFLFFCLLASYQLSQAQRPSFKPQTHQIDLQLGSMHSLIPGSDAHYLDGRSFALNYLNGLRYTYHYSLTHGFRAGVQRFHSFHDPLAGVITQFQPEVEKTAYEFGLGYMYKYHIKRSQLYLAADLLLESGDLVYSIQQTGIEEVTDYQSYGIKGGLGLRFFLSPYLSAGVEGNLRYARHFGDIPQPEPGYSFFQAEQISWHAQAFVSFHFVKMKKRCTCPTVGKSKYR
jgi:opacity protein-like surface antigen